LAAIAAATVSGGAPDPAKARPSRLQEPLLLEWPPGSIKKELAAYLAASLVPIRVTTRRPTLPERLSGPPFVAGEGRVALDLAAFDLAAAQALLDAASGPPPRRLSYEAYLPVAERLYLERRYFLSKIEHLIGHLGIGTDPAWQSVEVESLITRERRRIFYHMQDVLEPAVRSLEKGGKIVYDPGTWFLAQELHRSGGGRRVIETHVIGKRSDWEWDYALYDRDGYVRTESEEMPALFRSPSRCFTCHHSAGRMPPFADFPDASAPVGGFRAGVLVDLTARDAAVVRVLAGREARGDAPMGHYAGLAALRLKTLAASGSLPAWARPLWVKLLRHIPELAP
jgi:hypothetical protein